MSKVKKHFADHKDLYIGIGCGAVIVASLGYLYMSMPKSSGVTQNAVVFGSKNRVNQTVINLVENSTPSKPVHLVGSDLYFNSMSDAARKTGHSLSQISKNVSGKIDSVKGDVFELLQAA